MIWPINPVIEDGRGATALWLQNRGVTAVTLQIRIYRWTQGGGEDRFDEQSDVQPSPPMTTIKPGARHMVRLTNLVAQRPAGESAYRIIIDEVPVEHGAPASADQLEGGSVLRRPGIRFQMRYSIPLFVHGSALKRLSAEDIGVPQLGCRIVRDTRAIELSNEGAMHVRLVDVALGDGNDSVPLGEGLFGYVLAGGSINRTLPEGSARNGALTMAGRGAARVAIARCLEE